MNDFTPQVNTLIRELVTQIPAILGDRLVALIVTGSLTYGDFDPDISDVDIVAPIVSPLTEADYEARRASHAAIVLKDPVWDNRVEVLYVPLHTLNTFRTESSPIGVISPGEPLHERMADHDWLFNWYMARAYGISVYGPPPTEVIPPISLDEFVGVVRDHLIHWQEWVYSFASRPYQSYIVLTMCRTLYTLRFHEQVSKRKAANWAANAFPQWAALIRDALEWREAAVKHKGTPIDPAEEAATLEDVRAFVRFAYERGVGNTAP
ncbi:MAG: DUF4111 domain-containing protein [Anaerolineae bacterium]